MDFKTIGPHSLSRPPINTTEQVSNNMDRGFRIFSEGQTTNQKVYKESTTLAKVNNNLQNLRTKQKHYYERVPQERIDEFHQVRNADIDRKQKMVNNRFPELSQAREAFLGQEHKLPSKKVQADEVVNFSDVVEKLAQEEEPFPGRAQLQATQSNYNTNAGVAVQDTSRTQIGDRSRSMAVTSGGRNPKSNLGKSTLSASVKTKYIVRSRHAELTTTRFMPANSTQARATVKKELVHDAGEPKRLDWEAMERSSIIQRSVHGPSAFRQTSPITTDPYKAAPVTLDNENEFNRFCPPERKQNQKNPRLAVLDNFKEISRIMTQNFLTHKKLEKRYEKTAIPKSELTKMREEEAAQLRMTNILKKMHSPSNFAAPQMTLPGESTLISPYQSMMSNQNRNMRSLHSGTARLSLSPRTANTSQKKPNAKFISHSKNGSAIY